MQGILFVTLIMVWVAATVALHVSPTVWIIMLVILGPGTFAAAISLFHWVFSTAVSSVFLGLAMEGKATEATDSTPLSMAE